MGSWACVRSRAWICDFSSTERTSAFSGGVQVEAEDGRLLGLELGVGAAPAPVLDLVGPQLACAEDAVHRRRGEATRLREVPHAPGGLALQRRAGRKVDHGEALRGSDARRPTRALLVGKAVQAPLEEAPLPPRPSGASSCAASWPAAWTACCCASPTPMKA